MGNWQNALTTFLGLAVTLVVPAVVWTTLAAGTYQLLRDSIRRARLAAQEQRALRGPAARPSSAGAIQAAGRRAQL